MSDEVREEFSERGFMHLDGVVTDYGSVVRIYESSAATEPHIWMAVDQPPPMHPGQLEEAHAVAHMTIEQAEAIRERLDHMIQRTKERWGITE